MTSSNTSSTGSNSGSGNTSNPADKGGFIHERYTTPTHESRTR